LKFIASVRIRLSYHPRTHHLEVKYPPVIPASFSYPRLEHCCIWVQRSEAVYKHNTFHSLASQRFLALLTHFTASLRIFAPLPRTSPVDTVTPCPSLAAHPRAPLSRTDLVDIHPYAAERRLVGNIKQIPSQNVY
jgi:hypothetical protein